MFTVTPTRPRTIPAADAGACTSTTLFPIDDMMLVAHQPLALLGPRGPMVSADSALPPHHPVFAVLSEHVGALEKDSLGDLYLRTSEPAILPSGQTLPPGSYLVATLAPYDFLQELDKVSRLEKIDVGQAVASICDPATSDLDLALATCINEHVREYGFLPHVKVKARSPIEMILRVASSLHQHAASDPTFNFHRSYSKHNDSVHEQNRHSALTAFLENLTLPADLAMRERTHPSLNKPILAAAFQACDEHASFAPGLSMLAQEYPHGAFRGWGGSLVESAADLPEDSVRATLARTCGYAAMGYGFVAVCEKPVSVSLDELGRLHNEEGPSVSFSDGWRLFHWHGLQGSRMVVTGTPSKGYTPLSQAQHEDRMRDEEAIRVERCGAERYMQDRLEQTSGRVRVSPYAQPDHPVPMLRCARLLCIDSQPGLAFLEINFQGASRLIRVPAYGLTLAQPSTGDIERAFGSVWITSSGRRVRLLSN